MTQQYIYPPTRTIYRDLDDAYQRGYRVLSGGRAEPRSPELLATVGIYPFQEPTIADGFKRGDNPVDNGDETWTWEVISRTTEELAIERVAFINWLLEEGNRFIKYKGKPNDPLTEITMDAVNAEIVNKADKGKPKSTAIRNWGLAVGNSVLTRCEMIRQGAPMDEAMLDLSQAYGPAPACPVMPESIIAALQE